MTRAFYEERIEMRSGEMDSSRARTIIIAAFLLLCVDKDCSVAKAALRRVDPT